MIRIKMFGLPMSSRLGFYVVQILPFKQFQKPIKVRTSRPVWNAMWTVLGWSASLKHSVNQMKGFRL